MFTVCFHYLRGSEGPIQGGDQVGMSKTSKGAMKHSTTRFSTEIIAGTTDAMLQYLPPLR
jgi:hypothetical protein